MMLRYDPFRELDRLTEQLWGAPRANATLPAAIPMDAMRDASAVTLHFDLPGVDPAAIDVSVDGNTLTVSAERSWAPAEGAEAVASERAHGRFSRRLTLGDQLDLAEIEASHANGVLTLRIPVAEVAKPRKIEIQRAEAAPMAAIETTSSNSTKEAVAA